MKNFNSDPAKRPHTWNPKWTTGTIRQRRVSKKTLERNRQKIDQLIERARAGEVRAIELGLGEML